MRHIRLSHITRSFDSLVALDDVSLELRPGRIHGLLGENGAGKTTLMRILYGLLRPDHGQIQIDGEGVSIRSPKDAVARGIGMVHQHFMLAGAMTVLDNILLGDSRQGQWLDRRSAGEQIRALSQNIGLEIDPSRRVEDLSVGQQQRVEIIKALHRQASILILDEPTAVLTPQETDQLLQAMRRLRELGRSIIFISHKLGEILRICDDVAVLRRGRITWEGPTTQTSPDQLARHMVGRDLPVNPPSIPTSTAPGAAQLLVRDISATGLRSINLDVRGQILGVAGVDGNGQQELAEVLVGLRKPSTGQIILDGQDLTGLNLRQRTRSGVAHVPNDRKLESLVPSMGIPENILLKTHDDPPVARRGIISWREARDRSAQLVREYDVRCTSLDSPVSSLSGGNQQKLVLARELSMIRPRLIVAMNPTRGLDIAASSFVYQQFLEHRNRGCAIILISSELDDLLRVSDRIAVMYRGTLTMTSFPEESTDSIGRLMAGLKGPS